MKSNPSLLELAARKLVDKPALTTSTFSFIVSQLSALPTIASAAMSIGIGAATALYDAVREAQHQTRAFEQNQLYFYYRARQLFTDRTYEYRQQ